VRCCFGSCVHERREMFVGWVNWEMWYYYYLGGCERGMCFEGGE
jgi:hypothetical protein